MSREEWLEQKTTIVADLLMKVKREDWHGVADAAMDLREIEIELKYAKSISNLCPA